MRKVRIVRRQLVGALIIHFDCGHVAVIRDDDHEALIVCEDWSCHCYACSEPGSTA